MSSAFFASASDCATARRSCQLSAGATHFPVFASQNSTVERWQARPAAATFAPFGRPRTAASSVSAWERTSSSGSNSTQPSRGCCGVTGAWERATTVPRESKASVRELELPWSSARTMSMSAVYSKIARVEDEQGGAAPALERLEAERRIPREEEIGAEGAGDRSGGIPAALDRHRAQQQPGHALAQPLGPGPGRVEQDVDGQIRRVRGEPVPCAGGGEERDGEEVRRPGP